MKLKTVCIADAPGEGIRLPSLPPRPESHTIYLLPKEYPPLRRPFPHLRYDPAQVEIMPEKYYSPEKLTTAQLKLAWYRYKQKKAYRFRWRTYLLQKAPSIYYFAFDRAGRLIDYNPALASALQQLGRGRPYISRPVMDMVMPENRAAFAEELNILWEGHSLQFQRAIGPRYVEAHLLPLIPNKVYAYYALDTTVYRRLLETSLAQQALQETILGHLREGILLLDTEGKILYANPAAEKLLGREAALLVGTPTPLPLTERVFFYGQRPVHTLPVPLKDGRALLILRDLSDLWEAQKYHILLEKAAEEAPVGILLLEGEQVIYFNRTFRRWFPEPEEPLQAVLSHVPASQRALLARDPSNAATVQLLLRSRKKKTGWTHLLATFFPIELTLPDGSSAWYWVLVLEDQSKVYQAARQQQRIEMRQSQLIIEAQEKERRALAEELHDNLGVLLSVLKMELSGLLADIPRDDPLREKLQHLSLRLDEVIQTVRLTSHQLMPPLVEHFGLIPSIEGLIRRLKATVPLQVHFHVFGEEVPLPLIKILQVYRILQELITNTLRHAKANNLYIHFTYQKRSLIIEVWDDGCGYDPTAPQKEGIGLRNIQRRLQVLRARWENLSTVGGGARYRIEVPLPRKKS